MESNINNHEEYNNCKTQLEQIYKIKVNGMKIWSQCEWYELLAQRIILKIISKTWKKSF